MAHKFVQTDMATTELDPDEIAIQTANTSSPIASIFFGFIGCFTVVPQYSVVLYTDRTQPASPRFSLYCN